MKQKRLFIILSTILIILCLVGLEFGKEDEESLDKNENSNTKEEANIEVKQHSYKNEYII